MKKIELKLYSDSGLYEGLVFINGERVLQIYENSVEEVKSKLETELPKLIQKEISGIKNTDFIEY